MLLRAILACVLAYAGLMPGANLSHAQTVESSITATEDRIKAASLYKFLNYVEWPQNAFSAEGAPYVIAVVGADDISEELKRIANGRLVNNRPIVVKALRASMPLTGIHLLFIDHSEKGSAQAAWIRQAQAQPVLIVTETDNALQAGSMINFKIVDERIRFEIALDAAEKSALKINSRLLSIALSVYKGKQP